MNVHNLSKKLKTIQKHLKDFTERFSDDDCCAYLNQLVIGTISASLLKKNRNQVSVSDNNNHCDIEISNGSSSSDPLFLSGIPCQFSVGSIVSVKACQLHLKSRSYIYINRWFILCGETSKWS